MSEQIVSHYTNDDKRTTTVNVPLDWRVIVQTDPDSQFTSVNRSTLNLYKEQGFEIYKQRKTICSLNFALFRLKNKGKDYSF